MGDAIAHPPIIGTNVNMSANMLLCQPYYEKEMLIR